MKRSDSPAPTSTNDALEVHHEDPPLEHEANLPWRRVAERNALPQLSQRIAARAPAKSCASSSVLSVSESSVHAGDRQSAPVRLKSIRLWNVVAKKLLN
jgi:hypothetical protein